MKQRSQDKDVLGVEKKKKKIVYIKINKIDACTYVIEKTTKKIAKNIYFYIN